ncbi:ABC transporter permease [Actinomadura sp. 9N407]|uniref:ABC transporter permease n=1 Tax=Actinomadura sp. 9N407 TaxID=3375154 RepID=UPI0037B2194C
MVKVVAAICDPLGSCGQGRARGSSRWGGRVRGRLGDGAPVELRVVAIYDRSLGLGDFLLDRSALAGHLHEDLDDAVLVRTRAGADLRRLAATAPTVQAQDAAGYARLTRSGLAQSTTNVYIVLGLLVAFSAISIVNTCVMGTAERAREFALLRLVGASRGQVVKTICLETVIAPDSCYSGWLGGDGRARPRPARSGGRAVRAPVRFRAGRPERPGAPGEQAEGIGAVMPRSLSFGPRGAVRRRGAARAVLQR